MATPREACKVVLCGSVDVGDLRFTQVNPERDAPLARARVPGKPRCHRLGSLVVEAHPVDNGLLPRIAENAGPRVSRLRQRGHGADLHVPEAKRGCGLPGAGILVESRGKTHGVRKLKSKRLHRTKLGPRQATHRLQDPAGRRQAAQKHHRMHGYLVRLFTTQVGTKKVV